MKATKVVFVCTGNTCRSPMLKFMFENYIEKLGVHDITVDSAGTMRHEKPMSENTRAVLELHSVPYNEYTSKFCSKEVLDGADFVFTMTREHALELKNLYGNNYNIIPLYSVLGYDVTDPYGNGLKAYEEVYNTFGFALEKILDFMRK